MFLHGLLLTWGAVRTKNQAPLTAVDAANLWVSTTLDISPVALAPAPAPAPVPVVAPAVLTDMPFPPHQHHLQGSLSAYEPLAVVLQWFSWFSSLLHAS